MSNAAMTRPRSAAPGAAGSGNVTFLGVLRSEFIKFTSLPSTLILILSTIAVMVAFSAIGAWGIGSSMQMMAQNPEMMSQMGDLEELAASIPASGLVFAQLIIGALAVMTMSSEYATGSSRSTFVAAPTRQPVFWAKVLLVAVVSAVVALVSILVAFVVAKPIADNYSLPLDFSSEVFQRSLWFNALYVIVVGLVGVALGALLRNSAGGIVVLTTVFFVLPLALGGFGSFIDWIAKVMRFLPDQASSALAKTQVAPDGLEQWQNVLVLGAWIIIPLAVAALVLQRRDI